MNIFVVYSCDSNETNESKLKKENIETAKKSVFSNLAVFLLFKNTQE